MSNDPTTVCPFCKREHDTPELLELQSKLDTAEAIAKDATSLLAIRTLNVERLERMYEAAEQNVKIVREQRDSLASRLHELSLFAVHETGCPALEMGAKSSDCTCGLQELLVENLCEHEWTDARNQVVTSGEICLRCGTIRHGNRATGVETRSIGDIANDAAKRQGEWRSDEFTAVERGEIKS